jgi:hypothetical protein
MLRASRREGWRPKGTALQGGRREPKTEQKPNAETQRTQRGAEKKDATVENCGYLLIKLSWLAMQSHWPFFFIQVSVKRP